MIKILSEEQYYTHFNYLSHNPRYDSAYFIYTKPVAHFSLKEDDCNISYCIENKIDYYPILRNGGCIVASPGDFSFFIVEKGSSCGKFPAFLQKKLLEKGLVAKKEGNDLTIDGKKFMGDEISYIGEYRIYAAHISINPNLDLIKHICLKESSKEIIGLGKYNISAETLEEWLQEFCFYHIPKSS